MSNEAAPAAFLHALVHTTKSQTQVPRIVPATRFHHMKWIVASMGAPVKIDASHKPSRRTAGHDLPPDQRTATDPEVHIQLDYLLHGPLAQGGPCHIDSRNYPIAVAERPQIPAHAKKCTGEAHPEFQFLLRCILGGEEQAWLQVGMPKVWANWRRHRRHCLG